MGHHPSVLFKFLDRLWEKTQTFIIYFIFYKCLRNNDISFSQDQLIRSTRVISEKNVKDQNRQ